LVTSANFFTISTITCITFSRNSSMLFHKTCLAWNHADSCLLPFV
jgi:hypothetical protein